MHVSHGAEFRAYPRRLSAAGPGEWRAGVLIAYPLDDRHAASAPRPAAIPTGLTGRGVKSAVREAVERVLGQSRRGAFRPDRPLMGMGLESLDLLELRRSLSEALGVALDPTFFFRYGTPDAVVRYFSNQSVAEAPRAATAAGTAVRNRQEEVRGIEESGEGFAIVGMACRMSGAATDCAAFWDLLADQGDAVEEISAERWRLFRGGDVPVDDLPREGALLRALDKFDAAFFHVSPREATLLDPQQRLLLETVWHALEDAGISADFSPAAQPAFSSVS